MRNPAQVGDISLPARTVEDCAQRTGKERLWKRKLSIHTACFPVPARRTFLRVN